MQPEFLSCTIEEEEAWEWEFSSSLRQCLLHWGYQAFAQNDPSADGAFSRAVNTSIVASVATFQPEFVGDAFQPRTHRTFLSLNPMRWAFLSRRINPGVAADVRCSALLLFLLSNVFSFAERTQRTLKKILLIPLWRERDRDVRTSKCASWCEWS